MAKAGCIYRGQRLIIAAGSLEPVVAKETVSVIRENSGRCLFEVAVCRGDQTQIGPGRASPEKNREGCQRRKLPDDPGNDG